MPQFKWDDEEVAKAVDLEDKEFKDYAKVPFEMASGKHKVSGNAIRLYVAYYTYTKNWRGAKPKKLQGDVSQAALANKLGLTATTISKLTKELYEKGWIDIEYTGRNNKITLRGKPQRLISSSD